MRRRTTISLTVAALLSLSGMVYAANHALFSFIVGTFNAGPIGVAGSPDTLLATQFCDPQLLSIDCLGIPTPLTTIPGFPSGQCLERYMSVAPLASAPAGFTPRDIFITQGTQIFKFTPPAGPLVPFTTLPSCGDDHTGITFDHVGTFGNNMILTCENGTVWSVNGAGTSSVVATLPINIENEGPAVAPLSFGPFGGQILATNDNDAVNAIRNDGFVTLNAFFLGAGTGPESVQVIPQTLCQYCGSNGAFFQAAEAGSFGSFPGLYEYFPIDFSGLGGDILVPCEGNSQLVRIHFNGTSYDMFFFDSIVGGLLEGSAFIDCNIPSPTPTPTPTFTPTPTPTATATFTPTATATFTPTPTATAAATATSTPTPTPTPTVTPTTCGTSFVIGDLDAVVGNHVTFWGAQWWKKNHLSGGTAPASFKGFANCTNPNPPVCGGTWQSDPGNSSHPPDTVPADMTVIVSSLITKSGPIESGDIPKMVTIHTDPGYGPAPGHEGTGTVTAVVCGSGPQHQPRRPKRNHK
jgi:cell division septation protein DedD